MQIADSARLRPEWVPVMSIAQIIRLCVLAGKAVRTG